MARTTHTTPRYFQCWKGSWRIRVQVPAPLIAAVGKRELVRSLGTANLAKAEKEERKHRIISQFETMIEDARNPKSMIEAVTDALADDDDDDDAPPSLFDVIRKAKRDGFAEKEDVEPVTFPTIIAGWITDRKPGLSAQRSMRRFVQYLCESARVDWQTVDPNDITKAHMKGLKDSLVKKAKAPGYIKQCRAQLTTLWRYGSGEGDLTHNPLVGFQYIGESVNRRGFTDDEARTILLAARKETDPLLRWAPWIMAANGARISEIVGSAASAVQKRNGVWCLDLQDGRGERPTTRMPNECLKNKGSNRTMPLPQWLIDEGFLDYWRSLPKDGALFPGVKPSPDDGKRSHNASKTLGEWVREDLGFDRETYPRIGPDHSWRHRFKTVCRHAGISRDDHDALTGHTDGTASGEYGEYPLPPLIEAVNKLPHPLAVREEEPRETALSPAEREPLAAE